MALTRPEVELLGDLTAARSAETGAEMWSAIYEDEYLPEAHRLAERGWITRRVEGGELWWRITDEGMTAVEAGGRRRDHGGARELTYAELEALLFDQRSCLAGGRRRRPPSSHST